MQQFKIKHLKVKIRGLEEQLENKDPNAKIKTINGFIQNMQVYTSLLDEFDSITKDILPNM